MLWANFKTQMKIGFYWQKQY